jgi:hypothetical protein
MNNEILDAICGEIAVLEELIENGSSDTWYEPLALHCEKLEAHKRELVASEPSCDKLGAYLAFWCGTMTEAMLSDDANIITDYLRRKMPVLASERSIGMVFCFGSNPLKVLEMEHDLGAFPPAVAGTDISRVRPSQEQRPGSREHVTKEKALAWLKSWKVFAEQLAAE